MPAQKQIYASSAAFKNTLEAIDYCKKNNINLEISSFARTEVLDATKKEELEAIKEALNNNKQIKVSLHGACFDLSPASLDSRIAKISKERMKESLDLARFFNCHTLVFHSGYNPCVRLDYYKKSFIKCQIDFWKSFIEEFEVNDITLALENTYEESPDILVEIYEGVNSKNFKACVDVGHVNSFTNYDLIHWLKAVGPYLHHFHLHNNKGYYDDHLCMTKGTLIFDEFFEIIKKIDRPLQLTIEIFEEKELISTLNFLRNEYGF